MLSSFYFGSDMATHSVKFSISSILMVLISHVQFGPPKGPVQFNGLDLSTAVF